MKNNLSVFLITGVIFFIACKKDPENVSTVVPETYARISLKGPEVLSLSVGQSYTDEGATVFDTLKGTTENLQSVGNNIDNTKPGIYTVDFFYRNKYGYETVKQRFIAVTTVNPAIDLTGLYKRTSNSAPVNVKKISNGLYTIDNVGGVVPATSPFVVAVVMAMTTDSTISIPSQTVANGLGTLDCTEEKVSLKTDTLFSYVVNNSNFGNAPRTFLKQ